MEPETKCIATIEEDIIEIPDMFKNCHGGYFHGGRYGCSEYARKCYIECPMCNEKWCCRLCHNKAHSDHQIPRKEVVAMQCKMCGEEQDVSKVCIRCGVVMADYYCDICHLFDCPPPELYIYHCADCGECRKAPVGKPLVHCHACKTCVYTDPPHTCFKYPLKCALCSICGKDMYSSREQASFSFCHHWAHKSCLEARVKSEWAKDVVPTCPTCQKSIVNLEKVDKMIKKKLSEEETEEETLMPKQRIFCYECEEESEVPYHSRFHKCSHCGHYNTRVISGEEEE